jgi:hypothetical protein
MSKKPAEYGFDHHQPRVKDKKKRHRAGYSDEVVESRATRISFKNYVRQLEEEMLEDEDDLDDLN